MNRLYKTVDNLVFLLIGYLTFTQYFQYVETGNSFNDLLFSLINIAAAIYTVLRRRDLNTVTLAIIFIGITCISRILLMDPTNSTGFYAYTIYALLDLLAVGLIWFRPILFSSIKPWKGKQGFHVTKQDNVMWMIYAANGIFMLLMLLEHATRRINPWWYENSRILYNHYEVIQMIFIVGGLMTLYFMTFEKSKEKQPDRKDIKKI